MSKVVNPPMNDHFSSHGITFRTESDLETTDDITAPYNFDIKSIDMIWNPEFQDLEQVYNIPIFFKTPKLGEPAITE